MEIGEVDGHKAVIETDRSFGHDHSIFFVKLDEKFVGSFTMEDILRLRYMNIVESVIRELSTKEEIGVDKIKKPGVSLERIVTTMMEKYSLTSEDTLRFIEYLGLNGSIYQPEENWFNIRQSK